MTKEELIKWCDSMKLFKIPQYMKVEDANQSQVYFKGKWQNAFYSWSIFCIDGVWKYVETDGDRGYVFILKSFNTEEDATEYAKHNHLGFYRYVAGFLMNPLP